MRIVRMFILRIPRVLKIRGIEFFLSFISLSFPLSFLPPCLPVSFSIRQSIIWLTGLLEIQVMLYRRCALFRTRPLCSI